VNHICACQWDDIAASFQREHWVVVIIKLPKNEQVIVKFICLGQRLFRYDTSGINIKHRPNLIFDIRNYHLLQEHSARQLPQLL
jgi:hypothetical protein